MSIALVNHSTLPLPRPSTLTDIAVAVTRQVSLDFAPAWSIPAEPVTVGGPGVQVVIFDDSTQQGALGYHDRDPKGNAYARIFAKPVLDNGGDWTSKPLSVASVISHEVLELLADRAANRWADNGRTLYALEVCDPVESFSYAIAGVTVSDFVLPAWFDPGAAGPYSHLNKPAKPFALAKGGYAIVETPTGERQIFAEDYPAWRSPSKLSPAARTLCRLS